MSNIHQPRYFVDREDAARQLTRPLARYRGQNPLVLAIPRGGIPLGRIIADALEGELDVVLVRKLRGPYNPEVAIGAIDENGNIQLSEHARYLGADQGYVSREAEQQLQVIRKRRLQYSQKHPPVSPADRVVIVVDDGLATGATMKSALIAVRARQPRWLVCAVPVAAPETLDTVQQYADEVVCLSAPVGFQAVGQFYEQFPAVEDWEALALLAKSHAAKV